MPINLPEVTSGYNLSLINDNFQTIESQWDEKLDRLVSTQSNQMEQELDMNSNKILNHPPTDLEEPTDLVRVDALNQFGDFTGSIPAVASYVGDGVTTAFPKPVNASDARTFQVYVGGLRQEPYTDYFITDASVVFIQAPVLEVSVDIYGFSPVLIENAAPVYADPILANFTGDGSQTNFFVSAPGSSTDACFISIDGVNQTPFTDFTNAGGAIQFNEAPPLNSEIFVRIFAPFTNNATDSLVIADGSTEPRTLGARFAEHVNVKDFGAVGDGVKDDTVAIQNALDAAEIGENKVFFPSGRYLVSDTLFVRQCSLEGETRLGTRIIFSGNNLDLFDVTTLKTEIENMRFEVSDASVIPRAVVRSRYILGKGVGVWSFRNLDVRSFQYFFLPDPVNNATQADTFFRNIDFGYDNAISFMKVEHSQGVNYFLEKCIAHLTSGPVLHFTQGGCVHSKGLSVRDCASVLKVDASIGSYQDGSFILDGVFIDGGNTFVQYLDARAGTVRLNNFWSGNEGVVCTAPYIDLTNSQATVYISQCKFPNQPSVSNPVIKASGVNTTQKCKIILEENLLGSPSDKVLLEEYLDIGSNVYVEEKLNTTQGRIVQRHPDKQVMYYTDSDFTGSSLKLKLSPAVNDWTCDGSYIIHSATVSVNGDFTGTDQIRFIIRRGTTNIGTSTTVSANNGKQQVFVFDQFDFSRLIQEGEEIEVEFFKDVLANPSARIQCNIGIVKV